MILSLSASFERELRLSIQGIIDSNVQKANQVIIKIVELTSDSIERWAVKDIVDIFEEIVNGAIRSQVKQIYDYRNWVAHGKNINKVPPIRIDPKTVFIVQASTVL
jgi:wobble nucleotide-excising tRNase